MRGQIPKAVGGAAIGVYYRTQLRFWKSLLKN